ncbi:hypothetical protein Mapa_009060 [Marchantia paleacea]|nr:hypothetical protein Mapa_009060 [Marchantia paleacea]
MMSTFTFSFVILLLGVLQSHVQAADPDLLTDFFIPSGVNASEVDGADFTFKLLTDGAAIATVDFSLKVAFATQFSALTGLGVSFASVEVQPKGVVPLHIHARASEIIFIISGQLKVGFVDSTNNLFTNILEAGDMFVFPKGMVHYYANLNASAVLNAAVAFSSSEPGLTLLPSNLFGSGISSNVLEKSFSASPEVISSLKAPFEGVTIQQ